MKRFERIFQICVNGECIGEVETTKDDLKIHSLTLRPSEGVYRMYDWTMWVDRTDPHHHHHEHDEAAAEAEPEPVAVPPAAPLVRKGTPIAAPDVAPALDAAKGGIMPSASAGVGKTDFFAKALAAGNGDDDDEGPEENAGAGLRGRSGGRPRTRGGRG